MKNFIVLIIFLLLSCSTEKKETFDLIIANVNLIDGTGADLQKNVNIYVRNQKVVAIDTIKVTNQEHVIDGTGKYVIPGLFDCHVHTTDYKNDLPKLIHYGVTSIFVPGGSACSVGYYKAMRELGAQDSLPAPRIYHTSQHFTMEGRHPVKTYANSNWIENETVYFLRDTLQIETLVKKMAKQPILGIKITIEDGPAPPFVERIPQEFIDKTVKEAKKHGLEVYAHASDNEEFLMAIKGGAQNLVHFVGIDIDWNDASHTNAVDTLLSIDGSIVTTLMIDKSFLYAINEDWFKVPELNEAFPMEELLRLITPASVEKSKMMERLIKMDYGLSEVTLESIFKSQVDDIQKLTDLGLNMVLGTDAGNDFNFYGYSLHEEMQLLEFGGMRPIDIIKMGTHNAAKMMKVSATHGTVEPGKFADLVILDENPLVAIKNTLAIHSVLKNGVIQERITN